MNNNEYVNLVLVDGWTIDELIKDNCHSCIDCGNCSGCPVESALDYLYNNAE